MSAVIPEPARPRVAVVAHAHPSVSTGGAEISAYTLYRGLLELGCDAIFVAACPETVRARAYRESAREHFVFVREERFEPFHQLSAERLDAALLEILDAHATQVVNFHHYIHWGLGTLRRVQARAGLRSSLTLHEYLAICFNNGQMVTTTTHRLCEAASPEACTACFPQYGRRDFHHRKALFAETLSGFDQLISPSHFLARRYAEWGLDERRIFVIENGLAGARKERPHGADRRRRHWVFGFFGQINPYKGVDTLLEAAEILRSESFPNFRIRIHGHLIGQGDGFVEKLKAACEKGGVEYAGPYDNRAVNQLMGDCDYVLVPSRWWENSPVVIQEAYAAGCPVLCSGVGGLAEKVRPGVTGLHFRPGDPADLALRLVEAASEETHRKLSKGLPKPYGAAEMARRYLDAFAAPPKPSVAAVVVESNGTQAIDFG